MNKYCTWEEPVYSVCKGVTAEVKNNSSDNDPEKISYADPKGNFISILCDNGLTVLYAHLKKDTIRFSKGESVNEGSLLGSVGNSGNSTGPHLHIQANLGIESVNLNINGKIYKRNDELVN